MAWWWDNPANARWTALHATKQDLTPETLVLECLDLVGPLQVSNETFDRLVAHASGFGELRRNTGEEQEQLVIQTAEMLQLIGSVAEFQFG
jgi:hypothetical protein